MFEVVRQEKSFLLFLLCCALLIRGLAFGLHLSKNENYWQVDSRAYQEIAEHMATGQGITIGAGEPNFHRLPGYSLFLSSFYVFNASTQCALWGQVVLGACIPLLIFLLALVLFPGLVLLAKIAALYSVVHIGLVLYSGFLMTETLFIVFFLLFCLWYFQALLHPWPVPKETLSPFEASYYYSFCPDPACTSQEFIALFGAEVFDPTRPIPIYGYKEVFLAGLFLGCASMVRPVGPYFVILAAFALCIAPALRRLFLGEKVAVPAVVLWLRRALVLVTGWVLVVAPWLLRNLLLTGHLFFHTLPGGHFLNLSAARVVMDARGVSYWEARRQLNDELTLLQLRTERLTGVPLREIDRCHLSEDLAVGYFRAYPLLALKHWLTDMMRASLSLYSAELLYLENGRKDIDYFAKGRGIWALFERYLFPSTTNGLLRGVIFTEIVLFLFILIGFFAGCLQLLLAWWRRRYSGLYALVCVVPFMMLFIVISLAGGYARMRLPIEPFLIIFAWHFWLWMFGFLAEKRNAYTI